MIKAIVQLHILVLAFVMILFVKGKLNTNGLPAPIKQVLGLESKKVPINTIRATRSGD